MELEKFTFKILFPKILRIKKCFPGHCTTLLKLVENTNSSVIFNMNHLPVKFVKMLTFLFVQLIANRKVKGM